MSNRDSGAEAASARRALQQAFEQWGGAKALAEWIADKEPRKDDNARVFLTQLWIKLLGVEAKDGAAAQPGAPPLFLRVDSGTPRDR